MPQGHLLLRHSVIRFISLWGQGCHHSPAGSCHCFKTASTCAISSSLLGIPPNIIENLQSALESFQELMGQLKQ